MIKLGLIGAGRMGNSHAGILAKIANVQIAGVYDIKPEAAQAIHERYGARIYHSAEEMAESPEIAGLLICSPTYCHQEGVKAALKAKKTIFCEKPLCRTKEDADELLAAGQKSTTPFTVGFVLRHMGKTKKLKELLDAGTIGRIRFCNVDLPLGIYRRMPGDWFADFNLCGGVILDMLAHHVDLANWFFGTPKRIYAAGLLMDPSQPEPADYVASVVTYQNGIIANFICNWQRFGRSGEMMEIYGDIGSLTIDGSDSLTYYPKGGEKQLIATSGESGPPQQMEDFIECVRGNRHPAVSLQDGYNSLIVGLAMIESIKKQKVMEL